MLSVQNGRWECNEALALESATYFLYFLNFFNFQSLLLIYFQQFFSLISFFPAHAKKNRNVAIFKNCSQQKTGMAELIFVSQLNLYVLPSFF
jgi:hypothetical protein